MGLLQPAVVPNQEFIETRTDTNTVRCNVT